ncbi:type II toxin-antitoxin system HicA family toxin [Candidatus Falkowbacteria bacterium]|nr:type II toxin-antitoxin system HicA family toxin [Candidatus Falkowbacteria bacterium]
MPSLKYLPGTLPRKKLTIALERLGFTINKNGGKGSHYKVIHQTTQKSITIPERLNKVVLLYLLKEIERISGISWEDIKREL